MEQAPVQIGQFILGKNLGIGAFGKVSVEDIYFKVVAIVVVRHPFDTHMFSTESINVTRNLFPVFPSPMPLI
jgi:hypothetical protein